MLFTSSEQVRLQRGDVEMEMIQAPHRFLSDVQGAFPQKAVGFLGCSAGDCRDGNMSQAQVSDFFSQRKKGAARAGGPPTGSPACSFLRGNKESALCRSPVREEFVRLVDEAAGLSTDRQSASSGPDTDPVSPRTPKRSSAEAEFDLGAAVFSATVEHSSVKRRRQAGRAREAEANPTEKTTRRTARKKLVLSEDRPQAFCKDDITALRSRIQAIRQQAKNITTSTSPAASSHAAEAPPTSGATAQPASETKAVLDSGARAQPASETKAVLDSGARAQPASETKAVLDSGATAQPASETKAVLDSGARAQPASETKAVLDSGARAQPASGTKAILNSGARAPSTSGATAQPASGTKDILNSGATAQPASGTKDILNSGARAQPASETKAVLDSGARAPSTSKPKDKTASGTKAAPTSETRFTVARARELAARAQRRKEEREAGEVKQSQAPPPALAPPPAPDSGAEQPAYQRYHTLAQATPPGLSLPYQYKILAEMFRSMDTVVAMLYNRSETATFAKIKQGVQDMMHRRFEESHVGQIRTVFPAAFSFRQQKNIPTFNSNISRGSYQLTVEPVLSSDQNEGRPVLSASRLLQRRRVFHQNLISVVKQHHKAFLSSLVPPLSVPEDKLNRWHPRFNVDAVPAIQVGSLPLPPHTEKVSTAQEVLEKARSLITPKMEKALVSLTQNAGDADGTKPVGSQNPAVAQPPAPPAGLVPSSLKGVSQSLLDRIRAKEAQKLQVAMTRNPAQEERLLMLTRLGELARILRNVFVAEKKAALVMEVVCSRMAASYRSALSLGEMEKHLRLLAEVAPDWLSIHSIRKDFYLKLNKMVELNVILDKLNHRLREEERL
ncbi:DNA replication factor Cdt1 [Poeciliopsis prolifica]|uniref:DNA replication factor Cdt1 n=1 Tax=Poeciliopsis prolifica TaxID=188132 RepID=UPI002413F28D|nr:DNA replication factor Cdt1 [Poeciliopsis prolifica]